MKSDVGDIATKRWPHSAIEKSIKIDSFHSKWHFLQYGGRYVRRLPIAQRRFLKITDGEVEFWTKDRKLKRPPATRNVSMNSDRQGVTLI